MDRQRRMIAEREIRRRRGNLLIKCMIALLILVAIGLGVLLIYEIKVKEYKNPWGGSGNEQQAASDLTAAAPEAPDGGDAEGAAAAEVQTPADDELSAKANRLAQQYDYDGAIALLKSQQNYDRNDQFKNLVATYESAKASCTPYPIDQVTHVFFHTLVHDTSKAFDGDDKTPGYNQVMTTESEFREMISQMYNRGFVMVSLHDMVEVHEDGSVSTKELRLPAGKTPFVLSQDDCSYYHYMDGDGFAQKLIVTDDGKVKNTYIEDDGTVSVGDYDVVPIIDTFVEEHPDFSYHGHKGVLALTGYEGVLGYRTDEVYKTRQQDRVTDFQRIFFENNPDFNFEQEVAEATKVATAMREQGWEFASHTWGHISPRSCSMETVSRDTDRWQNWVTPIVGPTDILIFAFGVDVGDWQPYSMSNEYYAHYKNAGFNIFCNVDASVTAWVQIGSDFLRQARRNLDGYRMYYTPELLTDLFDVDTVWDKSRPTPVPPM